MPTLEEVEAMAVAPFSLHINLSQAQLLVVKTCVRQLKATDTLDARILEPLSLRDLQTIYESDVVRSIMNADMPETLSTFGQGKLAAALDAIIRRDELKAIELRQTAEFYASNDTFGIF